MDVHRTVHFLNGGWEGSCIWNKWNEEEKIGQPGHDEIQRVMERDDESSAPILHRIKDEERKRKYILFSSFLNFEVNKINKF